MPNQTNQTLRDRMLAVMGDVNAQMAEREELVEAIAIALLTRKNLFILGAPGQAKSYAINQFRTRITGARQFERLLSKQTDEEQLFGRIDLSSLLPGSVPESVVSGDELYQHLRSKLECFVESFSSQKDSPSTYELLRAHTAALADYRAALAALHTGQPQVNTSGKLPEADIVMLEFP